jgi:ribonuclease VapC
MSPQQPDESPAGVGRRGSPPAIKVLDASALVALLFEEPGSDTVADIIAEGAAVSSVNLSETGAVLVRHQRDATQILAAVAGQVSVEPFTTEDAIFATELWAPTRKAGLSLGDRACLALARRLEATAVTADRAWAELELGVKIQLVRSG